MRQQHQSHMMSTVRGFPFPIATEDNDHENVQSDIALSSSHFHRYETIECNGMSYRQLGKTSISVSNIAFGCGAIGGLFGNFNGSLDELLNEALRNGINYIDTGMVKHDPMNFLDRPYDYRAHILLEQLTMSLKRLKLAYVDICYLQLQNADFNSSSETIFGESLEALRVAKLTGETNYIGLASYTLRNILDIVMSYGRANLCDNSLGEYIHRLENKGVPLPKLAIDYATQFPGVSTCLVSINSKGHILQCLQVARCNNLTKMNYKKTWLKLSPKYFTHVYLQVIDQHLQLGNPMMTRK
uniref:Aldo_ket_red domain-containing protein n=1 Tax=Elaeophora elaphi TaxID=1147741 RepID=A0A0R3RSL9_9BILA